MNKKIKSVEKGWGEDSIFYTTNPKVQEQFRVNEIREEVKQISDSNRMSVYRGYKGDSLVFEMGISPDITVTFE